MLTKNGEDSAKSNTPSDVLMFGAHNRTSSQVGHRLSNHRGTVEHTCCGRGKRGEEREERTRAKTKYEGSTESENKPNKRREHIPM